MRLNMSLRPLIWQKTKEIAECRIRKKFDFEGRRVNVKKPLGSANTGKKYGIQLSFVS